MTCRRCICFGSLLFAFALTVTPVRAQAVGISEILYNGLSESDATELEWIEVYNEGNDPVSLQGWSLVDPTPSESESASHTISSEVSIAPGNYAVLCGTSTTHVVCDYTYNGIDLGDAADDIVLRDGQGNLQDQISYGGTDWPSVASGESATFTGQSIGDNATDAKWAAQSTQLGYVQPSNNAGTPRLRGPQQELPVKAVLTSVAGWRQLAPPMTGLTVGDVADDTHIQGVEGAYPNAYTTIYLSYDAPGTETSGEHWVEASSVDDALAHGHGYMMYVYAQDLGSVLSFEGPGPTSDVTATNLPTSRKWHYMGNPFPNAIDVDGLNLVAQGFQSNVLVWDPGVGSYKLVLPIAGDEVDGSDDIAAHQGFFAEFDTENWSGEDFTSLTYDMGYQVPTRPTFHKSQPATTQPSPSGPVSIRLRVTAMNGFETVAYDEAAAVMLHPDAGYGWDAWDATKLVPLAWPTVALSFPSTGDHAHRRAVSSIPTDLDGEYVQPIFVDESGTDATSYRISWDGADALPPWWSIELETPNGTIDLRENQSVTLDASIASKSKSLTLPPAASRKPNPLPDNPFMSRKSGTSPLTLRIDPGVPVAARIWNDGNRIHAEWHQPADTEHPIYVEWKRDGAFVAAEGTVTESGNGMNRFESNALENGSYQVRLVRRVGQKTEHLVVEKTAVIQDEDAMTVRVGPTPVVDRSAVRIRTADDVNVRAELFDVLGRRVATLHNGALTARREVRLPLQADQLSAGMYVLRVQAGKQTYTDKIVVAR